MMNSFVHGYPGGTDLTGPIVWVHIRVWTSYRCVYITDVVNTPRRVFKRYRLALYRAPYKKAIFPVHYVV